MEDNQNKLDLLKWMLSDQKKRRRFIKECLLRGVQNVHTPFSLCSEMIGKLKENLEKDGKNIKEQRLFVICNVEFVEVLVHDFDVPPQNISFFGDSKTEAIFTKKVYNVGTAYVGTSGGKTLLENLGIVGRENMKFDVIVGNPPYQAPSENNNKGAGNTLWNKFIPKSFSILKDNGFLCFVHPSGWRNVEGRFSDAKKVLLSKQISYLEIHNADDGIKTFGAGTRYDWYVAQNKTPSEDTIILGEDGVSTKADLSKMDFIPNGMLDEVEKLIAKNGEERVNFLYDCSYHSATGPVSKCKDDKFVYPCVMHVGTKTDEPSCIYYSSTKDKGHFGLTKVIFGRQVSGVQIDRTGEFGMSDACAALIDEPANLPQIQKAMKSEKFIELMKMCDVGGNRDRYNRKVISLFRKDFWKSFI